MGAYRSKPLVEKTSSDGEGNGVKYGVSEMQGWRVTMEDAWTCLPHLDETTSMFAVFDGHGGSEVAQYCSKKLPMFIVESDGYKNGNLNQSLDQAFRSIDKSILDEEIIKELKELAGDEADDEEDNETALLSEEATMPIEELLNRMKQGANAEVFERLVASNGNGDDFEIDCQINGTREESKQQECKGQSATETCCMDSPNPKDEIKETDSYQSVRQKDRDKSLGEKDNRINLPTEDKMVTDEKGNDAKYSDDDAVEDDVDCTRHCCNKGDVNDCDDDNDGDGGLGSIDDDDEDDDDDDNDEDDDADDEDDDDEDADDSHEDDPDDDSCIPESDEVGKDSGTTAIVALLRGNRLVVANVGDSRCVLCRGKKAVDMSLDHKPEEECETERIKKAGGKITGDGRVNGGLNLSRAIGDHNYKTNDQLDQHEQIIVAVPDVKDTVITKEDDFMILACDGIWNIMSSQEAVDFVIKNIEAQRKEGDICLSKICEQLFDACLAPDTTGDGSGCDNMTCIIVLFDDGLVRSSLCTRKRTVDEAIDELPSKKHKDTL